MSDESAKHKKNELEGTYRPLIHNESLMEIFDFSQTALNSNRGGFVLAAQREKLQDDLKNDADAMWLLMMIMLVAAVVVGVIMTVQGAPMIYLVIGAGILMLPMLYFSYTRQTNTRLDLEKTRVRSIQGAAQVIWSGGAARMRAQLRVHDKTFNLTLFQGKALEEYDLSYLRVYYAEHSQIVLAAEALDLPSIDKLKMEDREEDEDLLLQTGRRYEQDQA